MKRRILCIFSSTLSTELFKFATIVVHSSLEHMSKNYQYVVFLSATLTSSESSCRRLYSCQYKGIVIWLLPAGAK